METNGRFPLDDNKPAYFDTGTAVSHHLWLGIRLKKTSDVTHLFSTRLRIGNGATRSLYSGTLLERDFSTVHCRRTTTVELQQEVRFETVRTAA